jgi:hypothetical protein
LITSNNSALEQVGGTVFMNNVLGSLGGSILALMLERGEERGEAERGEGRGEGREKEEGRGGRRKRGGEGEGRWEGRRRKRRGDKEEERRK